MCGICGAIDWRGAGEASVLVRRMTPTMWHRGPDDFGYLEFSSQASAYAHFNSSEPPVSAYSGASGSYPDHKTAESSLALGMRRLSIIDIEGGHQPMVNEDGMISAVLNGEIYNFMELRRQLADRGHKFSTRADSEVVAHAYEEWGAACVERFEGMFAIAVYDLRSANGAAGKGKLFLARDRLGIKPLYYYGEVQSPKSKVQSLPSPEKRATSEVEGAGSDGQRADVESPSSSDRPWPLDFGPWTRFVFASEVRTLLASGIVPRRLSRAAVESYLLFGSVGEPMTLVDGVLSLPPGHRMTIDLATDQEASNRTFAPEPYWNIATQASRASNSGNGHSRTIQNKSAEVHVRELLEASVRKHLIADVPVGVFLSSGIDSTALAALASREVSGVHTFTVAFPEKEFSEAAIARRTAKQFGTTHQEVMLSGDEMLTQIAQAVGALDQPSIDGVNTYFVSRAARQAGLKVALSGLGGDEVFGGYNTFRRTPTLQRIGAIGSHVPERWRSAVVAAAVSASGGSTRGDAMRKLTAFWDDSHSLPHAYFFVRALFTPGQVRGLMSPSPETNGDAPWREWLASSAAETRGFDAFTAVTCMEARSYLVNTLLRDTDSMSMAHSLEVRVPFLDHPLVEFVTGLPQNVKLRRGASKGLLVAALRDLLPSEVIRQTKRGFTFPWANWLRGPLKESLDQGFETLTPALAEVVSQPKAAEIWRDYLNGQTSWSRPWSLYVLNEWVKKNFEFR